MPANDTELLSTLPPVLRAIIHALGMLKAQEFLVAHGGTYIVVPRKNGAKLGLTDEQLHDFRGRLADHLTNDDRLAVPKIDKLFLRFRDNEIRINQRRFTLNQLAKKYNLSSRQIQNICRGVVDDSQDDLFK